ncbi:MAG: FAD-dependent oxidoreductase [Lysobacterales bacterium]
MRIAVVGSGIAGLASAWLLGRRHEVTLFEADDRLGGHTDTHRVRTNSGEWHVDSGFIVCNRAHYPLLFRMFDQLGVATQPTVMTFSAQDEARNREYNAGSLAGLLFQPRNLVAPWFWRMLADIARFYREAPRLLDGPGAGPTLGQFLDAGGYSEVFREQHLIPMASALWSTPTARVPEFPARYLAQFMANHSMLQITGRPEWLAVTGGSSRYIDAIRRAWRAEERAGDGVRAVHREGGRVRIASKSGESVFDHVVLACHADQALGLLDDASASEREVLGAFEFQQNETLLHTDTRVLPRNRKLWAAWNAHIPSDRSAAASVSYCMNILQSLKAPETFCVTLNRSAAVDPARVLAKRNYAHPLYTHASVAAQARLAEIQNVNATSFAGAYWGWGFHEDGIRSAVDVARGLGVEWT